MAYTISVLFGLWLVPNVGRYVTNLCYLLCAPVPPPSPTDPPLPRRPPEKLAESLRLPQVAPSIQSDPPLPRRPPEKLAESLRLPQVAPSIQSAVLLCFRVLLLRMSSRHVVSLWPSIITELVQVLLQMEHQLCLQSDEFRSVGAE